MAHAPRLHASCAFAAGLFLLTVSGQSLAVGERVDGFPSWAERVHLQLANRARVEPQIEMTACGSNCPDAACYTPKGPLVYERKLGRAARFHADEMSKQGFFAHASECTLVSDIDNLYPAQCEGEASCACVGGTSQCSPTCTSAQARVGLFGNSYQGEIIAGGSNPWSAFYLWLHEPTSSDACQFSMSNGHRWLILTSGSAVGFGVSGYHVGDFGGGGESHPIPSGTHYPQSGSTVTAYANWYDTNGPQSALINVEGECTAMTLERGTPQNGTYRAELTGLSGCTRYFFLFKDEGGQLVTYPTTGSLGIGPSATCEDWSTDRPTTGSSCDCTPQCGGNQCGDDGCGGVCGNCGANENCEAGQCVSIAPDAGTGGTGGTGGSAGTGGTGGSAGAGGTGGTGAAGAGTGGASGSGPVGGSGGDAGSAGTPGSGGSSAGTGGGSAGSPDGGAAASAANASDPSWSSEEGDGCACRAPANRPSNGPWPALLLAALVFVRRRQRK